MSINHLSEKKNKTDDSNIICTNKTKRGIHRWPSILCLPCGNNSVNINLSPIS